MVKPVLTQAYARERLEYHEDGYLIWKYCASKPGNWNSRYAGKRVDSGKTIKGYTYIAIDYVTYKISRVIYIHVHGVLDDNDIVDHIDGNRDNNRIENLRIATASQNSMNKKRTTLNSSGYKGVGKLRRSNKWVAQICKNGKNHHLGCFETAEEAYQAYCKAANSMHGEFARLE
jgi:hypothetical protein